MEKNNKELIDKLLSLILRKKRLNLNKIIEIRLIDEFKSEIHCKLDNAVYSLDNAVTCGMIDYIENSKFFRDCFISDENLSEFIIFICTCYKITKEHGKRL